MHDNKLLLERYSAGETGEDESRRVEEHCKTCDECGGYLETLKNERRDFLALHPYRRFQQDLVPMRQPWYKPIFESLRRPALLPAYGFIVILLILSPIIYFGVTHHAVTNEVAFKGGDALSFLLKRNGRISVCAPRDTLYPGDEIQVLYSIVRKGYMSLVSVDSRGTISWYHPDRKKPFCTIPVMPGGNQNYPTAILLDDSKGQELVMALFSDAPLSTAAVQQWVTVAVKKTNANLSLLEKELDSTRHAINAAPIMALFQKGNH